MFGRDPYRGQPAFAGLGGGPPAPDVVAVLAVVFVTFSMQFFAVTAPLVALLRLTPAIWQGGLLWQLATYPFAGFGPPSLWFLLELLVLFWFARDVLAQLGRRGFWRLLVLGSLGAAAVAVPVAMLAGASGSLVPPFQLMQGQRTLLVLLVAAFALRNGEATILLFFVLPIRARWFIWLAILMGFIAFLATKDIAGFAGICAGTGMAVLLLRRGGLGRALNDFRLRQRQRRLERRLDRIRRGRDLRLVDRDDDHKTIN